MGSKRHHAYCIKSEQKATNNKTLCTQDRSTKTYVWAADPLDQGWMWQNAGGHICAHMNEADTKQLVTTVRAQYRSVRPKLSRLPASKGRQTPAEDSPNLITVKLLVQ